MQTANLSRRRFLRTVGAGAVACALPDALLGGQRKAKKPNVLFIAVDDLRPELHCFGQKHIISPHIDRLAAGGVVFNRS